MNTQRDVNCYVKQVRDVAHEYIQLTELDVKIINTDYFQRLRNIRQLTSKYVYMTTNHTRFEHSLGVMQLVRNAINHLQKNCPDILDDYEDVSWDELWFNGSLAGLFHDIGHLPFSHLGEQIYEITFTESERKKVISKIIAVIEECNSRLTVNRKILIQDNCDDLSEEVKKRLFNHGAIHELFSVYIFLKNYFFMLKDYNVNYDLIVRAILGIEYKNHDLKWPYNIVISLLNSDSIDMDKLDYIIRDKIYTNIETANIDTKRLFSNMTIHKRMKKITYNAGATSVLQNIIEARDSLYMWVYNHHISVYTDFIYLYLCQNLNEVYQFCEHEEKEKNEFINFSGYTCLNLKDFFSLESINEHLVSENDILAALKAKYIGLSSRFDTQEWCSSCKKCILDKWDKKIAFIKKLNWQIFNRQYLKPLWKTIHEYNVFMKRYFDDDEIRFRVARKVSENENFRKDIVKYIINSPECRQYNLSLGDVFIIPRANKFYLLETIDNIYIYTKENDLMEKNPEKKNHLLSEIIPQRRYTDIYKTTSFYIFVKKFCIEQSKDQIKMNKAIIDVFVKYVIEMVS